VRSETFGDSPDGVIGLVSKGQPTLSQEVRDMRSNATSLPSPSSSGRLIQRLVLVVVLALAATALMAPSAFAMMKADPMEEPPAPRETDPAGVVYDKAQYDGAKAAGSSDAEARAAAAIEGATVRLERKIDGEFRDVLSGDPGISPNENPQVTGENGRYQWNVSEGDYRVVVSQGAYETATSRGVHVPPAVTDRHVAMTKTASPAQDSYLGLGMTLAAAALLVPVGLKLGRGARDRR